MKKNSSGNQKPTNSPKPFELFKLIKEGFKVLKEEKAKKKKRN